MSIHACVNAASTAFGVRSDAILSIQRSAAVSRARFAAAWLAREEGFSFPQIASVLGRDHSSVIHEIQRAKELFASDDSFAIALAEADRIRLYAAKEHKDRAAEIREMFGGSI